MLRNNKGIAEVALLAWVIGGLVLLFVPNPISNSVGMGIRPNKIVEKETVTLIYDKDGVPIAYRKLSSNNEIQQKVTFFEWLTGLPVLAVFLMGSGVVFPVVTGILLRIRNAWKSAFKNQYDGLKELKDSTVVCRKCGDSVTIDTKEFVFDSIQKQMDKRDKVLQEMVRTELSKK